MGMVDLADDLVLTDIPGFPGVSVRIALASSFSELIAFKRFGELIQSSNLETEEGAASLESLMRKFGDQYLVEWNVGYRGEALPANGDGLVRCKRPMLQLHILESWLVKARGIDAPLVELSTNSAPSPELSVATAP